MLYVSALSVVIVIIAIFDMPKQEFSLCERVYIHNMYMESRKSCFMQISSKVSMKTCA